MTERKEAHQFSKAYYQRALEAAEVGIWDWDLHQERPIWSKECKAMLGLPPDAEENFTYFVSLLHPDDRDYVLALFAENYRTKKPHDIEYRLILPDGRIRWIADKGKFLYNKRGQAVRLTGVAWDITARKQAEEARRQADRHTHEILESVDEAFLHLDREWHLMYANPQAARMGGYAHALELRGQNFWEYYPHFRGTVIECTYRQVMETRQPATFEAFNPVNQRWYDIRVYPADQGSITSFYTDITGRRELEGERNRLLVEEREARKEAEQAHQKSAELIKQLEQKQAFLQAIMQQAPSGMIIAETPLGKIIGYNEEASRMLGRPPRENESYGDYARYGALHADGTAYDPAEYPLARAMLTGEIVKQEDMLYQRRDGQLLHLTISAAPIYDTSGQRIAAVVIFHDISEHFELEQRKDDFICLASHELRTPLTSLKGNVQLIERRLRAYRQNYEAVLAERETILLDQLTKWSERALRQANIESHLLNELLEASNVRSEELAISRETCNLVQIVSDTVDDMQTVAPPGALVSALPFLSPLPVRVDSVQIARVITNYIKNALRYATERQPVTVGISVKENEAYVWVRDTGPGLSLEQQQHVWERFYQAHEITGYRGASGNGLGLGLYICQRLIQMHNGRTGVNSAPGEGSTFWFALPIEKQAQQNTC